MSTLLRGQEQVSAKRGMPISDTGVSPQTSTSSSTTVQLYYYNAGVRTTDAGQAAGTIVDATFVHRNILNSLGTNVASKNDTSLAYTCNALTTELEIEARPDLMAVLEANDHLTPSTRAANVGALLNNGEFIVDYRRGLLIGKKATTTATMTSVTYNYNAGSPGSTGTSASQIQGNVAAAATDSGNPVKAGAVYNTTAPTYTNGQRTDLQADVNGSLNIDERYAAQAEDNTNGVIAQALKPLAVSTYSWTLFQNLGANATLNVKASAGSIKSIYCHNLNANSRYIQIHKTATTPGGGAVPALTFLVPGSGVVAIDGSVLGENGFYCTTGIAFAFSTTEATYTAGTAADQMTHIMYV